MKPGSTYRICEHCGEKVEGMFICKCQKPKVKRLEEIEARGVVE